VADRRGHPANLAFFTFDDFQLQPRGGNGFPVADGGLALPDGRQFDEADFGGEGEAVFQQDAAGEVGQGGFVGQTFNLHPVDFGEFVLGFGDVVLEPSRVGQDHQPFAVEVQPSGGVDVRHGDVIREGGAAFGVGELAEGVEGFVEEDQAGHG
jgi:hypothetical protein